MLIDSHAHLNDEAFLNNVKEAIDNAKNNGIFAVVCASYDYPSSERSVLLSKEHEEIFATVGIHPENAMEFNDEIKEKLMILSKEKKVVAWGEIGLDYHYDINQKDIQKKVFIKQIELANKANLPIIVHMRDATKDTLDILQTNKKLLINGGVIHCFSGSIETAQEFIKLGFLISFAGPLTYKNSSQAREVALKIPLDKILVETDSPYLSPVPLRGQINTPANVKYVALELAKIKNISLSEVEEQTTLNVKKLFKIE
ncbi:MAG: TatD family hydrolase [Clostridia bacterium]